MNSRSVDRKYQDPLELIWTHCAAELGISVWDDEVFASWDGQGTLRIGKDSLDEDDSLAQLVLHELCHAIVEGPDAFGEADWGLNGPESKSRVHEFAALRVQAHLADQFGLRPFFMATTDFYEYYLLLPDNPLTDLITDEIAFRVLRSVTRNEDADARDLARQAYQVWQMSEWRAPMERALRATAEIQSVVAFGAPVDSVWNTELPP